MEVHEFYLDGLNLPTNAPRIYRVALGQLIPARERSVFPPEWPSPYRRSMSGAIGFMDITRQEQYLPTKSARRDE